MIRLRLVNLTGNPRDTRLIDAETGQEIANVRSVTVSCQPDDAYMPRAMIEVLGLECDILLNKGIVESWKVEQGKITNVVKSRDGHTALIQRDITTISDGGFLHPHTSRFVDGKLIYGVEGGEELL